MEIVLLVSSIEDPGIKLIYQLVQLGRVAEAEAALKILPEQQAASEHARYLRLLIRRNLTAQVSRSERPCLVWQYDAFEAWEGQYLRELFSETGVDEVADYHSYKTFAHTMVCVENRLSKANYDYVIRAVSMGSDVVLIHLGDEAYADDCSVYPWCKAVFRNHWSLVYSQQSHVKFLPLGYKSGFARSSSIAPVGDRKHLWSFCGDVGKSTRALMRSAMSAVEGGFVHFTSGWDSDDALDVASYRAIMDASTFVPCPMGYCTPDSFRIYEALEAGCIPILERGQTFDYFRNAFGGDHPIPVIQEWSEAPKLIQSLISSGEVGGLANRCHAFWQLTKAELRSQFYSLAHQ